MKIINLVVDKKTFKKLQTKSQGELRIMIGLKPRTSEPKTLRIDIRSEFEYE